MTTPSSSTASGRDPVSPLTNESWNKLYEANAGPLFRYVLRLTLGNRAEAEDHLQETFLRAWRCLQQNTLDLTRLRPWLFTVARRIVIDAARAKQFRPIEVIVDDVSTLAGGDDDIDRFVQAQAVRDALRNLSPDHRAALIELYYHERTAREAAGVLGVPEGTVKSRAHYALQELRAATIAAERRRPGRTPPGATCPPGQRRTATPAPVRDARRASVTVGRPTRTIH
jgi:RNA polymerase sigma-70 factor, ECF subfamily